MDHADNAHLGKKSKRQLPENTIMHLQHSCNAQSVNRKNCALMKESWLAILVGSEISFKLQFDCLQNLKI